MNKDRWKCKNREMCDFKAIGNYPDAQTEVCRNCGKKIIYNRRENGKIDEVQYLADHKRDFIQKFTNPKLYEKIYGEEK